MACSEPITIATKVGNIKVRCKQCLPCRIHKQSALTARCLLEEQHSSSGFFLTLTFREEPDAPDYKVFSRFLKRLRRHEQHHSGNQTIRFLGVGEHGHKHGRFHFHSLIFNSNTLTEDLLTKLWPHGFSHIGTVTPASIRYTARYTLKFDQKGEKAMAYWSKKPPLGSIGIRYLARVYRDDQRRKLKQAPNIISIQGKSYPLDNCMRIEFMKTYTEDENYTLPSNALDAHNQYLEQMLLGDPIEA